MNCPSARLGSGWFVRWLDPTELPHWSVAGDNSLRLEPVSRESERSTQQLTPDLLRRKFASDFPHEIAMEDALHEINEILERKDINDKHKAMILGQNAKRFYNL